MLLFSFLQLVAECGVGIWVLVRCFVFKVATEHQITERLGDGFSRPVFATVVVLHIAFVTVKFFLGCMLDFLSLHYVLSRSCFMGFRLWHSCYMWF